MGLADITADDVLAAINECDDRGQEQFNATYGFGRSRRHVVVRDGRTYDSKPLLGAAHRHATGQALSHELFNGGRQTTGRLRALGFEVHDRAQPVATRGGGVIGHVPGVEVGATWTSRKAVMSDEIHRAEQAGIVGTGATGAESIVVSGGYEDDKDNGWEIIYTGHGGRDRAGRQIADQTFDSSGNAALQTSSLTGQPVRVVRGPHRGSPYAPESGFRYDGLFRVEEVWREPGLRGFLVCRFRVVTMESSPAAGHAIATPDEAIVLTPEGNETPDRRPSTVQRIIRSTSVADSVKSIYDHTCQTCDTRLNVGNRGYSEAAHIRALGGRHRGPDVPSNVLCLCPNCHILFDTGALLVDDDLTITVNGKAAGSLRVHQKHAIDSQHLTYHRSIHRA